MARTKIDSATITDMTNVVTNYEMESGLNPTETGEIYPEWETPLGYYQKIPELQSIIDKKALWVVGKGYKAKNEQSKKGMELIKGDGKDTANTILYNAVKTYTIGGDYFAEIVKVGGKFKNLKTLNPGSMRIITDSKGYITRYEQFNPNDKKAKPEKFKPEEIFHLSFNRQANSHVGTGTISKLMTQNSYLGILEMLQEAKEDLRVVFHRYVKPLLVSTVDTDNESEITAYKNKLDQAVKLGENLVIPKGTVENIERVSIPQYSTLDPLPWINFLESILIQAEGIPGVILGTTDGSTEATSKILYLAFQQMVEWNQLFLEEQIKAQLGFEIELEFPASLEMSETPKANSPQKDNQKARKLTNFEMKANQKVK